MKKTTEAAYRQGELVFIKVNIPAWAREGMRQSGKMMDMVIREGEITGHKHEIYGEGLLFDIEDMNGIIHGSLGERRDYFVLPEGQMLLTAENEIVIKHPEHKDLPLPKGDYIIVIQREYDETQSLFVRD